MLAGIFKPNLSYQELDSEKPSVIFIPEPLNTWGSLISQENA